MSVTFTSKTMFLVVTLNNVCDIVYDFILTLRINICKRIRGAPKRGSYHVSILRISCNK